MKLWLDDRRPAPPGWEHARTLEEAQAIAQRGPLEAASLDHDLGPKGTPSGYDFARWLKGNGGAPSDLTIHSANPWGAERIRSELGGTLSPLPQPEASMPYASDDQRRFMHAKRPGIAAQWDHEFADGAVVDPNDDEGYATNAFGTLNDQSRTNAANTAFGAAPPPRSPFRRARDNPGLGSEYQGAVQRVQQVLPELEFDPATNTMRPRGGALTGDQVQQYAGAWRGAAAAQPGQPSPVVTTPTRPQQGQRRSYGNGEWEWQQTHGNDAGGYWQPRNDAAFSPEGRQAFISRPPDAWANDPSKELFKNPDGSWNYRQARQVGTPAPPPPPVVQPGQTLAQPVAQSVRTTPAPGLPPTQVQPEIIDQQRLRAGSSVPTLAPPPQPPTPAQEAPWARQATQAARVQNPSADAFNASPGQAAAVKRMPVQASPFQAFQAPPPAAATVSAPPPRTLAPTAAPPPAYTPPPNPFLPPSTPTPTGAAAAPGGATGAGGGAFNPEDPNASTTGGPGNEAVPPPPIPGIPQNTPGGRKRRPGELF